MTNYSFNILVAAKSKAEAEAKLDLLIQMGTFFSDFSVPDLAGAFLKYKVLSMIGQMPTSKPQEKKQEPSNHN